MRHWRRPFLVIVGLAVLLPIVAYLIWYAWPSPSGLNCPGKRVNNLILDFPAGEGESSPEEAVLRSEMLTDVLELPPRARRLAESDSAPDGIVRSDDGSRSERVRFRVYTDSELVARISTTRGGGLGGWHVSGMSYC